MNRNHTADVIKAVIAPSPALIETTKAAAQAAKKSSPARRFAIPVAAAAALAVAVLGAYALKEAPTPPDDVPTTQNALLTALSGETEGHTENADTETTVVSVQSIEPAPSNTPEEPSGQTQTETTPPTDAPVEPDTQAPQPSQVSEPYSGGAACYNSRAILQAILDGTYTGYWFRYNGVYYFYDPYLGTPIPQGEYLCALSELESSFTGSAVSGSLYTIEGQEEIDACYLLILSSGERLGMLKLPQE